MGQPQTGRGGRSYDEALVVDGQHGVEGQSVMKGGDDLDRGVGLTQGYDDGPVAHGVGQGLTPLGTHDNVDAETFGGGQEILGAVGLRRQEEENAGHNPRMAPNDRDVTGTK